MADRFFLMGRSHLTALWYAWHNQTDAGTPPATPYAHARLTRPSMHMEFLQLEADRYEPLIADGALHPAVRAALAGSEAEVFVSVLGGNDHSMIGVAAHAPRFDFVLPEEPDLPLDDTALLVPAEMLRAELARRTAPHVQSLALLREAVGGRVVHLESPPPLPEAHIRCYPVPFAEEIAQLGVAPAPLRVKLWRLHSQLYREACARLGIEFIPSPPAARGADGTLRMELCHPDATHANILYGGMMLAQVLERCV